MKPRTRNQCSWERKISRLFRAVGLDSLKTKILVFALLATLIPSLTLARLSYLHNKQALISSNCSACVISGRGAAVPSQAHS